MTREPLRAFRIDDRSWHAARAAAKQRNVSVSEVIRDALRELVDGARPVPGPGSEPRRDGTGPDGGVDLEPKVLLAQAHGILMARYGCDARQARQRLRAMAEGSGESPEEVAASLARQAVDGSRGARPLDPPAEPAT